MQISHQMMQEDDRGVADFALVDFGVMFKFIEMEEASEHPATCRPAISEALRPRSSSQLLRLTRGWLSWSSSDKIQIFSCTSRTFCKSQQGTQGA